MFKRSVALLALLTLAAGSPVWASQPRPLIRNFLGLNGHFNFKPELYSQVCRLARNYHNMDWDVNRLGDPLHFPICVNKVNWEQQVYGKWAEHGFESDICVQFARFGPRDNNYQELWTNQQQWARQYGYEMAKYFGPSGKRKLVTSIEIGNEPGNGFNDELYRNVFMQMARGIRQADPKMLIVTATVHARPADKYSKSLDETFSHRNIRPLYDVLNLHVYATKPKVAGRSPWDRSYPEDPQIDYLKIVDEAIAWRDQHTPQKQVWITEFGYDAATPQAMEAREGWAKTLNWQGVTDLQQAQYLVRSLLCFSMRSVDRAYLYFYDDSDVASNHAAAGLTRHLQPKPSFWAVSQFYQTLGDYRPTRAVHQQEGDLYVYEFTHGADNDALVWVIWSPTGEGRTHEVVLHDLPGVVTRVQQMATDQGPAPKGEWQSDDAHALTLQISESPTYVHFSSADHISVARPAAKR